MMRELITSKHPVFKCSNILQTSGLMRREKGGGVGTHVSNEADNSRTLVKMILACNQLLFRSAKLDPEQDARSDSNLHC